MTKKPTLCWDCEHATHPDVCPWVERFEPVPGWKAVETVCHAATETPYKSYFVYDCPLFSRDGIRGGVIKCKPTDAEREAIGFLDGKDIEILTAYADVGMNVCRAARRTFYDRRTVSARLTAIRSITGIDPRDFHGLTRLISLITVKREEEKRGSDDRANRAVGSEHHNAQSGNQQTVSADQLD